MVFVVVDLVMGDNQVVAVVVGIKSDAPQFATGIVCPQNIAGRWRFKALRMQQRS